MLTLKEWDAIASALESQVMPDCGKKEETYLWAVHGALLTHMKENNLTIDEVLVICEKNVLGKTKGMSESDERKSIQ